MLDELASTVGVYAFHHFFQLIYSDSSERIQRLMKAFNVWLVFVGGVLYMLGTTASSVFLGAIICGGVLLWVGFYSGSAVLHILDDAVTPIQSIKNSISVMRMLARCKQALRPWDYMIMCYTTFHLSKCQIPACPITVLDKEDKNSLKYRNEVFEALRQTLNRRLKIMVANNPKNVMLRLFAIGYILFNTRNYMLAFEMIKSAEMLDLSYHVRFMIRVYWYNNHGQLIG